MTPNTAALFSPRLARLPARRTIEPARRPPPRVRAGTCRPQPLAPHPSHRRNPSSAAYAASSRRNRKAAHPGAVNARSDAARCPTGRRTAVRAEARARLRNPARSLAGVGQPRGTTTPRARRAPPLRGALSDASRGLGACHGRSSRTGLRPSTCQASPPLRRSGRRVTTRAPGGLEVRAGARAVYMLKRSRRVKVGGSDVAPSRPGASASSRRLDARSRTTARTTRRRAGDLRTRDAAQVAKRVLLAPANIRWGGPSLHRACHEQ
jgi:hypothetical protein